jgi:uncharacterized membrane protein
MKSDFMEFLGVWGILLAAGYAGLIPIAAGKEEDERSRQRANLVTAALAGACLLAAFFTKAPALVAVLPLAFLGLRVAVRALKSPEGNGDDLFTVFLLLLGVGMVAGCEFIYFKDNYGQDMQRMNTIFKFYHQAWPLLAVAVAVFGERAWRERAGRGVAVRATLSAAMALSLFYPVEAAVSRLRQHEGAVSLDLRTALVRRNSGDAAAIAWLENHAPGGSVVLEATANPYSEYARISSHTGIPTVLGWANHEGLWRSNDPQIAARAADVKAIYSTPDSRAAALLLRKYRVAYVVVGDLERRSYPDADSVGTLTFLRPTVSGGTTVYRVVGAP